ncbi:MAG: GNAT family N-acetyltransferase [Pseudomonadota bacterium]
MPEDTLDPIDPNQPIEIDTPRFKLRAPALRDVAVVVSLIDNPKLAWNLARVPSPYSEADATAFITACADKQKHGQEYTFLVDSWQDGVVGCTGLHPVLDDIWEIGYWVGEPYWGQGIATEAGHAVLSWARRTLGAEGFVAGHFTDNPASGTVLQRLGFQAVGEVDFPGLARGGLFPAQRYALDTDPAIALTMHQRQDAAIQDIAGAAP